MSSSAADSLPENPALDAAVAIDAGIQRLYEDVYPRLAEYCWSLVRDRHLAEDLAQEAFVRVVARWVTVREPKAYLFHVATNLVRDSWRRRDIERRGLTSYSAGRDGVVEEDTASAVAVRDAVTVLPRRLREVVLLYYYADLTVDQVAKAVRRPVGTVKRQLWNARAMLGRELEDHRV